MRIFITGASGFVGTNLCLKLKKDSDIQIIRPNKTELNLIDRYKTINSIERLNPDVIIHLAGTVGGILANQQRPATFIEENLLMGMNVIAAAQNINTKLIMLSTTCCYPKYTPVPFKEEDIWNGYPEETNAPYGIAKRTLVEVLSAYKKQYDYNSIVLILTNLTGPFDNFDPLTSHVIPAIILKIDQAIKNKDNRINIWGTGNASRDFLYVEDCADAIIKSIHYQNQIDGPINIGSGEEIKIRDLVNLICKIMGFDGTIVYEPNKPDGQPRRCLDITRAKEILGFEPKTSLEEGLTKTIKWYYENY